jgi:hypothetical protein
MGERLALPAVLESQDRRLGRHRIDYQSGRSMDPAADHRAFLLESGGAEPILERVVLAPRGDLDDHVDVDRRSRWWRARIGDPKGDRGTADEDDLAGQIPERRGSAFEEGDAQLGADARCRSSERRVDASERTRPSPSRMASIKANGCQSAGSDVASFGTFSWIGSRAIPRTSPYG